MANAISLDALKDMWENGLKKKEEHKTTLKEYLDSLEEPHPLYRSLSARAVADCSTTCGVEPTLNQTKKCASKKWVPEYKKSGECECLKRYRCCSDTCAKADNETCWNNGNKGLMYGIVEVDCCGCDVVKCLKCDPSPEKEQICPTEHDISCYNYNTTSANAKDSGCFIANCLPNPSDAPDDGIFTKGEVCPKNNVKVAGTSMCGSARDICKLCPQLIAKNLVPCKLGIVVKTSDCNGCDVHICQAPTEAGPTCTSGYFKFNSKNNQLACVSQDRMTANYDFVIYGARWRRFWWYCPRLSRYRWPAGEKDVLGHPYGSCMPHAARCFGRLPEYLRQDSTSILAMDSKGNVYKWKFAASNPTSNAAWLAFHDHVETPKGAILNNKIWNPQVIAGSRLKHNQQSFMYQDIDGVKSLRLEDNQDYCHSTLVMGPNGVENLDDHSCNSRSHTLGISLYFSEE